MLDIGQSIWNPLGTLLFLLSLIIIQVAIYRLLYYRKLTRRFAIIASLSFILLLHLILPDLLWGEVDFNPRIDSREQIAGTYSRLNRSITLNKDGTYTSTGFAEAKSGNWRNEDCTILLTNSPLQPRIVTRGSKTFLLPFYIGPDEGIGPFFTRKNE